MWDLERRSLESLADTLGAMPLAHEIRRRVRAASAWDEVPPLLQIASHLDNSPAVDLVFAIDSVCKGGASAALSWSVGQAFGGIFEASVKVRLRQAFPSVAFDVELPNRRDRDARAVVSGKPLNFECAALTESERDRQYWADYFATRAEVQRWQKEPVHLVDARYGDAYADARRVFSTVFEKLSADGDVTQSQMAADEANILCLGFPAPVSLSVRDVAIEWALEELLSAQPSTASMRPPPAGMERADLALARFLEHGLVEMRDKRKLRIPSIAGAVDRLLQAPRTIGAIALFDGVALARIIPNPIAYEANATTTEQIEALRDAMRPTPPWLPIR